MHSYLPFKNVPWVEIRPFAEWCAEVHEKKIQLHLAKSLETQMFCSPGPGS